MNARSLRFSLLPITALCAALVTGLSGASAHADPQKANARAEAGPEEVSLAVGETRTIPARDVKNYSEITGIVEIKLTSDATQFVLMGRKPGSSTLLLIKNDGSQARVQVNVFARPPALVESELEQLLIGLNVQPRRVGSQIVLDGSVSSEADLKRVQQVATLYPDQVTSLVQLGGVGGTAAGSSSRHLVRIDFYFVQYDKNSSYGVGLGWPETIGAAGVAEASYDFLAGAVRSATASVAQQPLPHLDIASRRGWAKVLKQATVVTNNDTEANFSNGGEQNFPVNTGLTIGVQRVPFGTEITVLPHYDSNKRELNLKLVADVSDLTAAVSGTPLPGRSTSRLTTNVSLKLGQSLVLSGIHSQSLTHSVSGLPGLSEIPILGLLFGSHSQTSLETEGAIFVVPSVVESVPRPAAELVELAIEKFKEYSGKISEVRAYERRPGASPTISR